MKAVNSKTFDVILVLIAFGSVLIAGNANAAAYPHSTSYLIECSSCHFTHSGLPGLLPPGTANPSDTIDDTPYNNLCRGCHVDGGQASGDYAVKVHSSNSTESRQPYEWGVECIVCHDTHAYEQAETYTATNDYYFEGVITGITSSTITVDGAGWSNNQFTGFVVFPDKQNLSKRYKIISNTADTLTLDPRETLDTSNIIIDTTVLVISRSKILRTEVDREKITYIPSQALTGTNPGSPKVDGPAGFTYVVGDGTGICEVCHVNTKYHRNNISGDHTHYIGQNCMTCHSHAEGFKPDCELCHGDPPEDSGTLVFDPSATGATTPGAHAVHAGSVLNNRYSCATCHFNGMPATEVSGNEKIQIGFSGIAVTGSDGTGTNYKGQTLTSPYSYEQTNGTAVTVDESLTCENLYCHSTVQGSTDPTNPPVYKNPTWDDTFGMQVDTCNNRCHTSGGHIDTTKGTVLTSGSHEKHLQFRYDQRSMCQACHYYAEFQVTGGAGCQSCHNRSSHPSHVNQEINVIFNEEFPFGSTSTSGTYTGTLQPGDAYGSCGSLYCHSPGNKASAPYDPPNNTAISWNGSLIGDCSDCHGGDKTSTDPLTSGSHSRHITSYPIDCSVCHQATAENSRTYSSTQYGTTNYTTGQRYHADGLITISYDAGVVGPNAEYDNRPQWLDSGVRREAGSTYGDCNNIYCHSIVQTTTGAALTPDTIDYKEPTWGGAATTCSSCHASSPPSGSHPRHLAIGQHCFTCHYSAFTPNQACTPCHNMSGPIYETSTPLHVNNEVDVSIFMLNDRSTDGTYNGSKAPADGFSTCDNTYCHSNGTSVSTGIIPPNTSPVWGTAGPLSCDSCHEYGVSGPSYNLYDPKANSHVKHNIIGVGCETCHYTTTTNGTSITNLSRHANRDYDVSPSPTFFANGSDRTNTFDYVYDAGGSTCSNISCHTYWTFGNTKKWGGASLTPSSIGYDLTDQGDYGVTVSVGSPTCKPDSYPDSVVCPSPYTYIWDFSDGYSVTTTTPSVHYEFGAAGTYTVTLTQIATNGLSGTRTSGPFTPNPPPPPTPQYNPQAVLVGNTVTVTVDTNPPNPDIGKIEIWWDWPSTTPRSSYISFPATMQRTYSSGTYNIRVKVTTQPDRDEYVYEWNTADCPNCPTLQVTVP